MIASSSFALAPYLDHALSIVASGGLVTGYIVLIVATLLAGAFFKDSDAWWVEVGAEQ